MSATSFTATGERLLNRREQFPCEEAAEILGVSVHTIKRDVRRGNIKANHYGRRILIPRSEIERILVEGMK